MLLALLLLVVPGTASTAAVGWGLLSGVAGAAALALLYACLALGPMSILSPLTAVVSAIVPVGVGLAQGGRDVGEPGAQGEDLDRCARPAPDVGEAQERVGVGAHRPRDVEQDDDPARAVGASAVPDGAGLTVAPNHVAQGRARVDVAAARGPPAVRHPPRRSRVQ